MFAFLVTRLTLHLDAGPKVSYCKIQSAKYFGDEQSYLQSTKITLKKNKMERKVLRPIYAFTFFSLIKHMKKSRSVFSRRLITTNLCSTDFVVDCFQSK